MLTSANRPQITQTEKPSTYTVKTGNSYEFITANGKKG